MNPQGGTGGTCYRGMNEGLRGCDTGVCCWVGKEFEVGQKLCLCGGGGPVVLATVV